MVFLQSKYEKGSRAHIRIADSRVLRANYEWESFAKNG
jgi:hypothetical protein